MATAQQDGSDLYSSFFSQLPRLSTSGSGSTPAPSSSDLMSSIYDPMSAPTAARRPTPGPAWTPTQTTDYTNYAATPPIDRSGTGQVTPAAPQSTPNYTQQVQQLQQITDPTQRAIAQDQLARTVYSDLQAAGHDVKWSGNQLMVDGRPYEIAGAANAFQPGTPLGDNPNTGITGGRFGPGDVAGPGMPGETTPHNYGGIAGPGMPIDQSLGTNPMPGPGGAQPAAQTTAAPAAGGTGGWTLQDFNNGVIGGDPGKGWSPQDWVDWFNVYHPKGAPGSPGSPGGPGGPTAPSSPFPPWMNAPTYTPGDISTQDLSHFSYQDLLRQMGPDYVPTPIGGSSYQAPGIGRYNTRPGGPVGGQEDALISSILQHPESLDPQTVEMMKARSRQEQADLYKQEQDNLTGLAYSQNISDAPWTASQRLQAQRDRDAAVMTSNRNIDIQAATQNAADRRAAATLGDQYVTNREQMQLQRAQYLTGVDSANATQQLQAAQLRAQSDIANNTNLFNAAKLRQDKVVSTVNSELQAAAATTDRMRLREQVKQAATDLGISQEKVYSQWLESMMQDATRRYGIDTSADLEKLRLNQGNQQFKDDLAFRYASLSQQGDLANQQIGLGYGQLQEQANQFATSSYLRSLGL